MKDLVLIAHNLRSTHNIGSLLRTADGLGIKKVYFTGYTPYPMSKKDNRLPYISRKIDAQIAKTALGAEKTVDWMHDDDIKKILGQLHKDGYEIIALEQTSKSIPLTSYKAAQRCAVIVGREVEGLEPEVIRMSDMAVEIPMFGAKESFNVVQAAAIFLSYCRFS